MKYNPGLTPEQTALLRSRNFTYRPLTTAGYLDIWAAINLMWHPYVTFCWCFVILLVWPRMEFEVVVNIFWILGLVVLAALPTMAILTLIFGVVVTKFTKGIRWSAVLYWTWWPFWKAAMIYAAAYFGTSWGNQIWYNQMLPYLEIGRLQQYGDVDPVVGGTRLQDAGLITFNESIGVDRSRTGCIKNGATWCVAPVVRGGNIPETETFPPTKVYDLFMAGVDCCTCPGEFRCGAWNYPGRVGGYRVIDLNNREFYRLATEDFASTYGRGVRHPLFFEWVADPIVAWTDFKAHAFQLMWLALFTVPFAFLTLSLVLNAVLKYMHELELALPNDFPIPEKGLGRIMTSRFLPHMHQRFQEAQGGAAASDPSYVTL